MRRNDKKIVDFGTQAGIQVAVGDLVSILAASVALDKEFWGNFFLASFQTRCISAPQTLRESNNISKNGTKQPEADINQL